MTGVMDKLFKMQKQFQIYSPIVARYSDNKMRISQLPTEKYRM